MTLRVSCKVVFFLFCLLPLLSTASLATDAPLPTNSASPDTTSLLSRIASLAAAYPLPMIAGSIILVAISALIIYALVLSMSEEGRRILVRLVHITWRMLGVEVGIRGLTQLGLYSALPAGAVSFVKGYSESKFDWHTFFTVFFVISIVTFVSNLISQNMQFKRALSPGAGRVWRTQRKAVVAGIIQRINRHVTHSTPSITEVKKIIQDLLDVIVLHVRDHQGNFRNDRPRVFANLLIEDGSDLVVVGRDSTSYSSAYQRPVPARYPKETMLCGRVITARKVLSVRDLVHSYPEGPKNKPYRSILAIPLFGAEGSAAYGALSLDCSEPYFFDSFTPEKVENDLENSLQPYVHLITLTLEALVSTDRAVVVARLTEASAPLSQGGQP